MLSDICHYQAISPLLASSGQPDERQLAEIAAHGYSTVINLGLHDDPRYALPDERGTVEVLGMAYLHIPVQFTAPTREDLARFCTAMAAQQTAKTWVHCAANKRVSVFLGLYWHLYGGQTVADAFALQRGIWEPDAVWERFIAECLAA
jgi:protein tyrosine phosphatase (PTP) superfamily phosphohydrolase (DUF442 family)